MKLSENYNSAKAKYGEIADRMRAARISDGFLLSACRFNQENGVPPEDLFNYFHQWCIYVLRHKRIDVNTLDFSGFYSTIQEYKNKYGIPNQIYNDGKAVIGLLRSSKDLAYFPVKVSWYISQPKMFQQYTDDPMAYTMYIIDNGQSGKSDTERYVCMLIDKNGEVSYWSLDNYPMSRDAMMEYDETLTQGALSYIGKLCQDRKGVVNEMNRGNRTIRITESEIRDIVLESVSKILSESQLLNESYTTRRLGKYTIVNGDNEPHSIEGLETYGNNLYDVAMYDTNDETICVFSVGKNSNKFIYCRLEYSKEYGQWLGFTPLKYYDAPYLIRQDIKENFTNS